MIHSVSNGFLRRTLKNTGWLLGGKGVGGLLSLVYLGLAGRGLGLEGFGIFALILAYAQAIANIVQFQSWQIVIHYGSVHLADERPDRLTRLLGFAALIDAGSAIASAVLAMAFAATAGALLGLPSEARLLATLFGASLIFSIRATPTSVLRLFDRFDLATYAETVTPVMRFAGALIAYLVAPASPLS